MRREFGICLLLSVLTINVAFANGLALKKLIVQGQNLEAELAVTFSDTTLEALDASVPLSFLQTVRTTQGTIEQLIVMSYAPLYERFELIRGETRSYFRLRAELLDAFSQFEPVSFKGQLIEVRVQILISKLPAPMRIPALFSSDWNLDTGPIKPNQALAP